MKNNQQLPANHPLARELGGRILTALAQHERFMALALPRTILPFLFARYTVGMAYGEHLDLPLMGTATGPLRTDLSMTVFLSPPASYDGGELRMKGSDEGLRGEAGDAVLYPAGPPHEVTPVTRGTRLVAVTWIQSMIADPERRDIVGALAEALVGLEREGSAERGAVRAVHHALVRRWAQP